MMTRVLTFPIEKERQENIERNRKLLEQFKLKEARDAPWTCQQQSPPPGEIDRS